MNAYCTQVQKECMQNYGDNTGSWGGDKLLNTTSLIVHPGQRWRAQPKVPQMADLPPERLRLLCPPFYSTGVDCFGPYHVKIGRRVEKRWGIIFKCLTTRAVHRASQLLGCGCLSAGSSKIHSQTWQTKGDQVRLWHKLSWCRSRTA